METRQNGIYNLTIYQHYIYIPLYFIQYIKLLMLALKNDLVWVLSLKWCFQSFFVSFATCISLASFFSGCLADTAFTAKSISRALSILHHLYAVIANYICILQPAFMYSSVNNSQCTLYKHIYTCGSAKPKCSCECLRRKVL